MKALVALLLVLPLALVLLARSFERLVNRVSGPAPPVPGAAAHRVHATSFVADLHADSLLWGRDLAERSEVGHVDLPRLRAGGVALQVFGAVTRFPLGAGIARTDPRLPDLVTLLVALSGWPAETWTSLEARVAEQARRLADVAERDGRVVRIRSRDDLAELRRRRAEDPAFVGALLAIEGAHALDGGPGSLERLFDAGVRMLGLVHFFDDEYAGSAHGLEKHGLTAAGRELVARCEELGIVLDLAHASPATIDDVLATARKPVVVSHTGLRATCDDERNLSDEQVRRIAAAGGVVGIGFWKTAVCERDVRAIARAVRHAVDVAGDRHVALGSDFDGAVAAPIDAAALPSLTQALFDAGLEEESIRRVLGENVLRVLGETLPAG